MRRGSSSARNVIAAGDATLGRRGFHFESGCRRLRPEQMIFRSRDRHRAEGALGAVLFAAGPCFTATNGHCSQYGIPPRIVNTPEEARHEGSADLAASGNPMSSRSCTTGADGRGRHDEQGDSPRPPRKQAIHVAETRHVGVFKVPYPARFAAGSPRASGSHVNGHQRCQGLSWTLQVSGSERCPGWERSDRSGAFLEALRGAHYRFCSCVSGALCRASPGCGGLDGPWGASVWRRHR